MYSDTDLDDAVAAGALTPDAAAALRDHVAATAATPLVDEEQFRLVTGFNDIFVTIAAILLLVAVGWIGNDLPPGGVWGLALVAAAAWGLAEYFTRRRRMALPSIVLLIAFVIGVFGTALTIGMAAIGSDRSLSFNGGNQLASIVAAAAALTTAVAAWLHWQRFHVPITVAAMAGAAVTAVYAAVLAAVPALRNYTPVLALIGGLALFALAMRWDMADRTRTTRRSDVAFWLHLTAAPLIAAAVFGMLGVFGGEMSAGMAIVVLVLYVAFGIIALAIDRRALLVSSLAYVLYAMQSLFTASGQIGGNFAFTGLVIGSALLLLSAFWHPIRRVVVRALPASVQAALPATDRAPGRAAS